jgi:hypothetical protein
MEGIVLKMLFFSVCLEFVSYLEKLVVVNPFEMEFIPPV